MTNLVCMGTIIDTHGVKGRVKIRTYTEDPKNLTSYGDLVGKDGRIFKIRITGQQPENILAEIENINCIEDAVPLIGTDLYVARAQLPDPEQGQYYYNDLIGLEVHLLDQTVYGKIVSIDNYGAGEVVEIEKKDGAIEACIFNPQSFPEVNIKEGYAIFNPPEIIEVK